MSKKWVFSLCIVIITITSFPQDKIKGNKNFTTIETKIDDFTMLRFGDKFEIELIKSEEASVEIETDENLHDVIKFSVKDSMLTFRTTSKIQSSKRLNITVRFTESLRKIETNGDAEVSAVSTIENDDLELRINDYSKAFLNVKNNTFKLINNNRSTFGISSKSKLNIESNMVTLELNENSKTEALIESDSLRVDMYQSAYAKVEGDVDHMNLTTINSSDFSAKNLTANTCEVITEDSSDATIQVLNNLIIETTDSSEIYLYGDPEITIKAFKDTSTLHKKEL